MLLPAFLGSQVEPIIGFACCIPSQAVASLQLDMPETLYNTSAKSESAADLLTWERRLDHQHPLSHARSRGSGRHAHQDDKCWELSTALLDAFRWHLQVLFRSALLYILLATLHLCAYACPVKKRHPQRNQAKLCIMCGCRGAPIIWALIVVVYCLLDSFAMPSHSGSEVGRLGDIALPPNPGRSKGLVRGGVNQVQGFANFLRQFTSFKSLYSARGLLCGYSRQGCVTSLPPA